MKEVFPIIPARLAGFCILAAITLGAMVFAEVLMVTSGAGLAGIIPVTFTFLVVLPLEWICFRGSRKATFEVSGEGLRIRGDLWGQLIPRHSLDLANAQVLDLTKAPEFRTSWKSCGTNWPGYKAGWFSLKKGGEAFVYLTDETRVVYIPTHKGYRVMLSTPDPQKLLDALRR